MPTADADPRRTHEPWRRRRILLPAVAIGGMAGASARYAIELAWQPDESLIPWSVLTINASGCLAIGLLSALLLTRGGSHPLLRPTLGVGFLGGFTTVSTSTVGATVLAADGSPGLALGYVAVTLLLALTAVTVGSSIGRRTVRARIRSRAR